MERKKVFLYMRKARKEGPSTDQYEKLEKYCAENGLEIIGAFIDVGQSGLNLNRPALQQLISSLEQPDNEAVGVVFADWSRLTRNPHHTELILERLARVGVKALSVEEGQPFIEKFIRELVNTAKPFNDLFAMICLN